MDTHVETTADQAPNGRAAGDDSAFEVFDDDVAGDVRDPYPELAAARRAHPVQRLDTSNMPHADDAAVFFVYGYDDILEVLRDGRTYSSAHIIDMLMGDIMGKHIILGMDDPEHRRYRALVSTAFRQKALANWEERLIEPVADELIDRFADRGRADLVTEFTFPFPTLVTAGMLGLPREDLRRFQRWSIAILGFHTNRERAIVASQEVKEYLAEILAERRREPREDLISDLSRAELDGEKLSDEEIFSFLRLLLPAGIETTYRSTGNMLYSLLSRPDQLQALRENRALVPRAVEESIRYETPLLNITRMATTSTVLHDVPIPQGSTVMLMLAAANRDESRWHDPDDFDIFRAPRPHMSFGQGSHNCLGIHLARTEMRLALEKLLDKLPNLRLDPEADDPHIRGQVFRSPTALPVLFG
ncbi:Cytochrome P450 107B1 [Nocardia sp. RB20]|uniref:Cytochrome P450 107B1 n=1 Tax=Nocardia macrotermitis TaxID=2585198 RepID=A0A7K0D348_9NOCA|nr:Cytochrome P450 107B1 [Nocardia macrotermitis]